MWSWGGATHKLKPSPFRPTPVLQRTPGIVPSLNRLAHNETYNGVTYLKISQEIAGHSLRNWRNGWGKGVNKWKQLNLQCQMRIAVSVPNSFLVLHLLTATPPLHTLSQAQICAWAKLNMSRTNPHALVSIPTHWHCPLCLHPCHHPVPDRSWTHACMTNAWDCAHSVPVPMACTFVLHIPHGPPCMLHTIPWLFSAPPIPIALACGSMSHVMSIANRCTLHSYWNHGLCYPTHSHTHDFVHHASILPIDDCTFTHPTASAHTTPVLALIVHHPGTRGRVGRRSRRWTRGRLQRLFVTSVTSVINKWDNYWAFY